MSIDTHTQERWGTRIGLVLAMAGNAVGLGNFLRFPVQAAQNGGGTFMIPYFISFILLGIPLMWVEWGVGRFGGQYGHHTLPGTLDELTDRKKAWAKYIGVMGVVMPLVVFIYYTYIVSWMLGFSLFSLTGGYFGQGTPEEKAEGVRKFLVEYQTVQDGSGLITVLFFAITIVFLGWILARGISGGIEKLALYGVPLLLVLAAVLVFRILTMAPQAASPSDGLNFIWNPDWASLGNARVWVAAAGQMFFTLSVGMGSIQTYSSYLRRKDDVTLTGLSTAATNEFAEVVLGGTLAIPAAVVFFGVAGATAIAQGGSFDLGIVAMGAVFQGLPGAEIWAFLWFFLLFIAGATSCVALASPAISFLQDELKLSRKKASWSIAGLAALIGLFHVVYLQRGVLDEWDYWAGTFGLVVFAAFEIVLFSWVFGIDRGWEELHRGADLRIPGFYKPIMKWVTPIFLFVLLGWWGFTEALPTLLMEPGVGDRYADPANRPYLWIARGTIVLMLAAVALMVRRAWKRRADATVE
ncbi:MAG: sodium-dependent transporter [Thermoanaerobaculia bacterium]|nr:sodium-dependent transporter [Thermoanaerobaculia bacterium]